MSRLNKRLLIIAGNSAFFALLVFIAFKYISVPQFDTLFPWLVAAICIQATTLLVMALVNYYKKNNYLATGYLISFVFLLLFCFACFLFILSNSMIRVTY